MRVTVDTDSYKNIYIYIYICESLAICVYLFISDYVGNVNVNPRQSKLCETILITLTRQVTWISISIYLYIYIYIYMYTFHHRLCAGRSV